MWSNGCIWIFYHYIKGARQTDQYGFCPSFLSTDPWAIYLSSEADPWVKFPLVYRSVHLFVPTASPTSSLYELYSRNIQLLRPLTHWLGDTEGTWLYVDTQKQGLSTEKSPLHTFQTVTHNSFSVSDSLTDQQLGCTLTVWVRVLERRNESVMTNLSEQRQQFCCCSPAVCFPEH